MDPYLEHPSLWPDVHNRLIAELGNVLGPLLRPRYVVRVEERTYLIDAGEVALLGRPDLAVVGRAPRRRPSPSRSPGGSLAVEVPVPDRVRETWLEVRTVRPARVVTVLEILSPANKAPGEGRRAYLEKRVAVLGSRTSLVEIDLLRGGDPMPLMGRVARSDHSILVSRADHRPRAELRTWSIREPIPRFRLPLPPGEVEPEIDLRAILENPYDRASYDLSLDYTSDPVPPLDPVERRWAIRLLRSKGLR